MKSRDTMPKIAAFVDQVRLAFGTEHINVQMQRGVRGEPVFHAWENGFEVGTPLERGKVAVKFDQYGVAYVVSLDGEDDAGSN
ncbi:MAG: hypothetical protein GAK35_02763 [Herbaspirillum frisingense]|uniref:Uncharacterized protein n=1 Tax=Herbaspirillum frisingense TaxID=92645 RepID=A0A7V8FVW0_9BURK|nr:MAG: hypothetical protein GAK35_02763 [Herbaspirillum frisingense]